MNTVTLQGIVQTIIFHNEENGYTVMDVLLDANQIEQTTFFNDASIIAVGSLPSISAGESVCLTGEWVEHRDYGLQFKIEHCKIILPEAEDSIEQYLAGGFIKGVGPATAKNIVRAFGTDTLWIIEHQPHRLAEIKGISRARAEQISESYLEHSSTRTVLMDLQQFGLTPSQALALSKQYGHRAVEIIQNNPYCLVHDIQGIGFRTADDIAQNLGLTQNSPVRIQAGLLYTLQWARKEGGHTCFPQETLIDLAARSLEIDASIVAEELSKMLLANKVVALCIDNQILIALPVLYKYESTCAYQLLSLYASPLSLPLFDVEQQLRALERESNMQLDDIQRNAVMNAFEHGTLIITGGPGTGKTTIIHFILSLIEALGLTCELCAPTGRAAKRMSEATNHEARTIHRLLEYTGEEFLRDEENMLSCDVIIVDEVSMVDIPLFYHFLKAISPGTRLILVGDVNQLPSVGPGSVLKDMIQSQILPTISLKQVFRQSSRSKIILNAHKINEGKMPDLEFSNDFAFESIMDQETILSRIVGICKRKKLGDVWTNLQILSPTKKGTLGVKNLNNQLQAALNEPSSNKEEVTRSQTIFREGDKIMQIRNNYSIEWTRGRESGTGVFNGDFGVIASIDSVNQLVEVLFDDHRVVFYEYKNLDNLDLAYAISIHKSQGSEFPIVLMPVFKGPPLLMTRNLLYTAITRARDCVVLLGQKQAIQYMIENIQERQRYSSLCYFIWSFCTVFDLHAPEKFYEEAVPLPSDFEYEMEEEL